MSQDDQRPNVQQPTSNSPESRRAEAAHQRSVRFRLPITVVVLAGLTHAGIFMWADGDLSIVNFSGMIIWLFASLIIMAWFFLFSGARRKTRLVGLGILGLGLAVFVGLFRWDGQTGDFVPNFAFRFAPSSEDRAAEYFESQPTESSLNESAATERLEVTEADWPRFGGANEDQIVRGVTIRKDWDDNPPKALWRHPVGPAWSSFAVVGNYAFTQEQRGENEAVVCYNAETGKQIWAHTDPARFEETASGVGPRTTPTIHESRLYALGATGILNCLNPISGQVLWSSNIVEDANTDLVMYGMAGSPLIHDDLVIVNPSGQGNAVAAYDRVSGEKRWSGGTHAHSYASPMLATIDDVPQVLIYCNEGICGHDISTGQMLWLFEWTNVTGLNLAQPIVLPDQSVFISSGYGSGSARLDISRKDEEWTVEPRWETPNRFKLKFNGGILSDGYLYGLDEGILSCIDIAEGGRQWKQGRYRYGQMLMVDGDLLIVTEQGQVVLVEVTPESANEIGKFQAIEGKTWNHPVLNRGLLLVRNGKEAACYDLRAN
jgi:outer membrane protein assembly factor BamB